MGLLASWWLTAWWGFGGLGCGGFGSLPRPGVVDSVGLGLCRGLGWLNRWLGVVVGSPEVELGGAVPFGG